MRLLYIVSILLFSFVLYLLAPNLAAASIAEEATRIPYQVNNSDRIIIGTVSNIATYSDSTVFTIAVKEWLYNPLPTETIKVRSRTGTNIWVEDEIELTQNESALLMLKDENPDQMLFRVPLGIKYPVSDRDAVIGALKAQGKWTGHDQIVNRTNDIGLTSNAGTAVKQEEKSNTTKKSNSIPFIRPVWVLVVVLGVVICVKTKKH
jgi:hypothetical protein